MVAQHKFSCAERKVRTPQGKVPLIGGPRINGDGKWNAAEDFTDLNGDDSWNAAEKFEDLNGNTVWDVIKSPFNNPDSLTLPMEPIPQPGNERENIQP